MKKSLIVLQDGYKECGAASLLSIVKYYHGNVSISKLIDLTHTDHNGTNFYHLKSAANEIGLDGVGYHVDDIDMLRHINKPFICQLVHSNYEHFIVVYKIRKKDIIVMDPASGERKIIIHDFQKLWTGYIMIFSPRKKLMIYQDKKYLNDMIIDTLKKNKAIVFDILLLSIIFMLVSFIITLYFQIVLDYILDTTHNNLLIITFFFFIVALVKAISSFFRNELFIFLNQKIDCSLLLNTFRKILLLPYNYYKNRTTGEIISRVNDLIVTKNLIDKIVLAVCLDLLIFITFSIILLLRNKIMSFFLMLIILMYILIFYLFQPRLKKEIEISQINSAKVNSYLVEMISGYETIKNMHLESIVNRRMEDIYLKALYDQFRYDTTSNLEMFLKDIISYIGILLLQFIGFYFVMNHKMSFSNFLTFTFLANYVLDPVKNMLDLNKEYYFTKNSLKRANHLFEVEEENFEKGEKRLLKGNIIVQHLSFYYREEQKVLEDVCFRLKSGEKMVILGSSGSGKSTIFKILLKYYTIGRNLIYLDNMDLNDYTVSNIREQISCISQNEILFHDTIRNNIVFGRNIIEEEFNRITEITYINQFVQSLFLGYDTELEENGLNLSGGQKQRIILARMLLSKSPIMLIDEGLNAIDVNLERKILKNIFSNFIDKTFIVVSHRKENIDLFQHVIELNNGRIKYLSHQKGDEIYD